MFEELFSIKVLASIFTANMDSKMHFEILKNCKSDIDYLHPNGILLLWDNDSKHKSEVSLDYYIENKIQLFELTAYSQDLNPI